MWVLATTQFPWAVRVTKANPPTGSGGRVGCAIDVKTAPAGTITLNEWQGSMAKAAFTGTTLLSLELDELDFYGDMAAFYLPAFFALVDRNPCFFRRLPTYRPATTGKRRFSAWRTMAGGGLVHGYAC